MYTFKFIPRENIAQIIPFLQILDVNIPAETLEQRLNEMFDNNYKCVGAYHEDRLIGVSGLWILTKYYIGRHIEPDNVIIHPDYRSRNVGDKMVNWIHAYGKANGCVASELNCYTGNTRGQKFWSSQGYEIKAFHYRKMLDNEL